jgi:hypothetical protein
VRAAYFDRVSLSSTGYHATPDIGYDFKTNTGNPFNYFTYGVACSLVEIDCLTGDHQVSSHRAIISRPAPVTVLSVLQSDYHPSRTSDHQVISHKVIIIRPALVTIKSVLTKLLSSVPH